jgi:hypothetical protein
VRLEAQGRRSSAGGALARNVSRRPGGSGAAFAAEYGRFGWELSDLEWTLEVLKAEEGGRSLEVTGPIEGDIGEIVKIALPTITGPLATRLINMTIDWARERVKRTQVPETIAIYGPEGQLVRRVEVSWTGEVNDAADDV